jgi:PKD repeat protein
LKYGILCFEVISVKITIVILLIFAALGFIFSCSTSVNMDLSDLNDALSQESADPIAILEADIFSGYPPLEVLFTGSGSSDPDGGSLTFSWDFGDGENSDLADPPAHTYDNAGIYTVTLTVQDPDMRTDFATVSVEVLDSGVFVDKEQGIVAGLTLDENIDENSPVEIIGDVQWVEGVDGSGMEFDTEGEYILLPDSDTLDLTDQGTVEVWVYPYTNIAAAGIVHKGVMDDYSDESYSLQYNQPGQVAFILTNEAGTPTYVISNEGTLSTNQWHHIVAAWDLNDVYLYIDGSLVTNRKFYQNGWKSDLPSDFAPARDSDGGLMIGSQPPPDDANNYRFNGIIDNVLLYDRVLDSSEVLEHYTALVP